MTVDIVTVYGILHYVGAECSTTQPAVRRTTTAPVMPGRDVDKCLVSPSHGTYNERSSQELSTYHSKYIQDVAVKCLMKQLLPERRYATPPLSHLAIVLVEMQLETLFTALAARIGSVWYKHRKVD